MDGIQTSVRDLKLGMSFRDGAKALRIFSYDVYWIESCTEFCSVFLEAHSSSEL